MKKNHLRGKEGHSLLQYGIVLVISICVLLFLYSVIQIILGPSTPPVTIQPANSNIFQFPQTSTTNINNNNNPNSNYQSSANDLNIVNAANNNNNNNEFKIQHNPSMIANTIVNTKANTDKHYAYALMITNSSPKSVRYYFNSALAIRHALNDYDSQFPLLVLMIDGTVWPRIVDLFSQFNIYFVRITKSFTRNFRCRMCNPTHLYKLGFWNINQFIKDQWCNNNDIKKQNSKYGKQYKYQTDFVEKQAPNFCNNDNNNNGYFSKILYLDSDIVLLDKMDDLLLSHATPAFGHNPHFTLEFNTGLILFEPDKWYYQLIIIPFAAKLRAFNGKNSFYSLWDAKMRINKQNKHFKDIIHSLDGFESAAGDQGYLYGLLTNENIPSMNQVKHYCSSEMFESECDKYVRLIREQHDVYVNKVRKKIINEKSVPFDPFNQTRMGFDYLEWIVGITDYYNQRNNNANGNANTDADADRMQMGTMMMMNEEPRFYQVPTLYCMATDIIHQKPYHKTTYGNWDIQDIGDRWNYGRAKYFWLYRNNALKMVHFTNHKMWNKDEIEKWTNQTNYLISKKKRLTDYHEQMLLELSVTYWWQFYLAIKTICPNYDKVSGGDGKDTLMYGCNTSFDEVLSKIPNYVMLYQKHCLKYTVLDRTLYWLQKEPNS